MAICTLFNVYIWIPTCSVISDSLQPMDYIAWQAPLSIDVYRQEYWSGLPFPPPGDLTKPEIKHIFCIAADSLQLTTWEHHIFVESPKFPEACFLIQD